MVNNYVVRSFITLLSLVQNIKALAHTGQYIAMPYHLCLSVLFRIFIIEYSTIPAYFIPSHHR